jgi:hypothetical protein
MDEAGRPENTLGIESSHDVVQKDEAPEENQVATLKALLDLCRHGVSVGNSVGVV